MSIAQNAIEALKSQECAGMEPVKSLRATFGW
jgi:hypothetical protein